MRQTSKAVSQSFQEKMSIPGLEENNMAVINSQSFSLQGSFIRASQNVGDASPAIDAEDSKAQFRQIWGTK